MTQITDPEAAKLARFCQQLKPDYEDRISKWANSSFGWIKQVASRSRGAIGEDLLSSYLTNNGFDVTRSPDQEADRIVNGKRAEIKMSTLWQRGGYKFQQIRDQNYDFIIFVGISPFHANGWAVPKALIMKKWRSGAIPSQHKGRAGKDTAWLHVKPESPEPWLGEWGGSISSMVESIAKITGQEPLQ